MVRSYFFAAARMSAASSTEQLMSKVVRFGLFIVGNITSYCRLLTHLNVSGKLSVRVRS